MATLSVATAAAAARCSTTSRARRGRGSNARSASPPARRRGHPGPWFRRSPPNRTAYGCSWCIPRNARRLSAANASGPWTACAPGWRSWQIGLPPGKTPEKVGAAAARILARNHGHRYYDWRYEDGIFRFFEHPVHFVREQAYEGKYVIQSEEPHLSVLDAVGLYKELSEVERAFADLKDVIEMRPIYHQTAERVQAHIYVAALAFLLHRAIEKKLKTARLDLSATEALIALKSVRVVDLDLGNGQRKRSVTRGTQRASSVLRALGIVDLDPPTHPNWARPSCSDKPPYRALKYQWLMATKGKHGLGSGGGPLAQARAFLNSVRARS